MNTSREIGKVMGIPVRLHWTFLAIIVYVGVGFGYLSQPIFGIPYGFGSTEPMQIKWLYSFAFAILLFACVALHEMGHSYVARVYGIGIRSITLYFFGGVSSMEDVPRNPRLEFEMAFAGPGVSGIIGLACILLYFQSSALLGANHPFTVLLSTLGIVNLILMVFNLLPAFPMDGGRVLRSWLATQMPYMTATNKAASIGKMFAILMGIFGLFSGGILLLVIAFFIYIGASEEERATTINICLEGIKVRNIMSSDVHTVPPGMNLRELTDLVFREKHRGYPVAENEGLLGMVTITDIRHIPESLRESTTVGDVMSRKIFDIGPDEGAIVAMKKMTELELRRLPVIENGRLVGILSREDLVRAMESCSGGGNLSGGFMAGEVQASLEKPPEGREYQGIGIRLVSLIIDNIIIGIIIVVIGSMVGFGMMAQEMVPWWIGLLYFVIYIGYFALLEGSRGQTIGKMITKIKVVGEDGKPIDMNQALIRNLLRIIDGLFAYLIGAILIWRSDKKQRLGDSIAKTVVVKKG